MTEMGHILFIRVYFEDTDWSGSVYHAGYLRFLERGRTEYLRSVGIAQSRLHGEDGTSFVVSRIEIDYRGAARMDDMLRVTTTVSQVRGATVRLLQTVKRDDALLVNAVVTVAAVRGGRAVRLSPTLVAAFESASDPGRAGATD